MRLGVFGTFLLTSVLAVAAPPGAVPAGTEFVVRHLQTRASDTDPLLSGQLTLPRSARHVPGIVLISGSGPHTREQTISGCPTFRMLADHLVSRGFAVLSADARGYGYSDGDTDLEHTTADRTRDVGAWLKILREQPEIDSERIGLLGHSEGALIALELANKPSPPAFAVLLGAPGQPCGKLWVEQTVSNLKRRGASAERVESVRQAFLKFVAIAARGFDSDAAYFEAGREVLAAHGVEEKDRTDKLVDQIVSDLRRPWFRDFLAQDPTSRIQALSIPTLVLWGALDEQVPPDPNMSTYQARSQAVPNLVQARTVPGDDHYFLRREGVAPGGNHDFGRMHLSSDMLGEIDMWLEHAAGHAGDPATRQR